MATEFRNCQDTSSSSPRLDIVAVKCGPGDSRQRVAPLPAVGPSVDVTQLLEADGQELMPPAEHGDWKDVGCARCGAHMDAMYTSPIGSAAFC